MRKPDIRYWVLWLFLLGIVIIVFLQVISGYNITRLTDGNQHITREMQVQNSIRKLQSDVLILESDLRGAIITNVPKEPALFNKKISDINSGVNNLRKTFQGTPLIADFSQLEKFISRKVSFSRQLLQTHRQSGKAAAQKMIADGQGINLRDSIDAVLSHLDKKRQNNLKSIVGAIESTGRTARIWGFVIAIIALLAVVSAFWYVLNQGRQQQKMIQLLNESDKRSKEVANMKEQFLANMSHEIRTPMNAILGFTSLLRRTTLNITQRQYVQNLHSAGENLLALVNDILDLSKIEAGMMSLEETRFSLQSLVSSVGAMFSEKIKEKNLRFAVNIDKEVPDILSGDAVRLTQILVNLLSNAVKFTEEGKIEVNVQLLEQTEEKVRIRIVVTDTGIGISPEKQNTIFERFQQAETETTRRFGGTGLGLAIVKQLIVLQNGSITLNSQPGSGSAFSIELTYAVPDVAQLYAAALTAQEEAVPLQKISVLIAEDNNMNQQLIAHLMKSWNIDYVLVGSGTAVVEELKQQPYSLVLMDIQMPEMDGYTATSIIRNELKSGVPIIAMTAHAMAGEKEKCLQLGMNDYISKPIKETVLYNMIGQYARDTGAPDAGKGLIKLEYLRQLSGGDARFEREILEQFVVQGPQELQQLQRELSKSEFSAARQTAHSLKSTVGYIGLSNLLELPLTRIENAAAAEQKQGVEEDLELVKLSCEAAFTEVQQLLESGAV